MGKFTRVVDKSVDNDDTIIKFKLDEQALSETLLKQRMRARALAETGVISPDSFTQLMNIIENREFLLGRTEIEDSNLNVIDRIAFKSINGTITIRVTA